MSDRNQRKLHLILDDIFHSEPSAFRQQLLREFINHPLVALQNLRSLDALVIAYAWKQQLQTDSPWLNTDRLLKIISRPDWSLAEVLAYLATLIDRCILNTREALDTDYRKYPIQLLQAEFRLGSNTGYLIMDLDPVELIRDNLDYYPHSEKQLAEMVLQAFDLIKKFYWEAEAKLITAIDLSYPDYYLESIDPLINLLRFGLDTPLSRSLRKAQLTRRETAIVIYLMYRWYTDQQGVDAEDLIRLVSANPEEEARNAALLDQEGKLISTGLVRESNFEIFLGKGLLSYQPKPTDICDEFRQDIESCEEDGEHCENPALKRIPCSKGLASLILPQQDLALLRVAVTRLQNGDFEDLERWGINPPLEGGVSKYHGLLALFYGEPGTGKTFAAGAVAAELEKELISIDATLLRNHWYGDSEKLVRGLFEDMARIVRDSDDPPVFLLNECDQIIHRRDSSLTGSHNTENAIQNIILEQLENFPGILIMTTNLVDNIDAAYFRRFNIKLQFTRPDEECRLRLWKAHLLPTIPGAECIPVAELARDFEFTGGQISLVIQNACFEAVSRETAERRLKLEDILKYARVEQPWIGKGQKRPVGF